MSNKRINSIIDSYTDSYKELADQHDRLIRKYNRLMEEHLDLSKKYKYKIQKCKELEERDNKHFENFLKEYPHLIRTFKPKPKSHWNLS